MNGLCLTLTFAFCSDQKTRADVEEILTAACGVVPDENLKMHCVDMVRQETEVIFNFIQKVMDPNVVCRGMQVQILIILALKFDHSDSNLYCFDIISTLYQLTGSFADLILWTRLLKLSSLVLKICQRPRSKLLVSS